jgi:hypothetical protein
MEAQMSKLLSLRNRKDNNMSKRYCGKVQTRRCVMMELGRSTTWRNGEERMLMLTSIQFDHAALRPLASVCGRSVSDWWRQQVQILAPLRGLVAK